MKDMDIKYIKEGRSSKRAIKEGTKDMDIKERTIAIKEGSTSHMHTHIHMCVGGTCMCVCVCVCVYEENGGNTA